MIYIEADPSLSPPPEPGALERAAEAALRQQSAQGTLTVMLTDDEHLRELNLEYLGLDAPTDVLSFPAGPETDPETGEVYLGDVIISVQRAAQQAAAGGHAPEAELQLLVVHGVLHLLGHDHAGAADKARMWAAQSAILDSLGLAGLRISE